MSFLILLCCLIVVALSEESKFDAFKETWCGDENCYAVLDILPASDFKEIKSRYNNISLELHPDKNPNATEAQKEKYLKVTRAYEILSNSERRRKYDEFLLLKASIDSPREHIITVLIILFLCIAGVVYYYKTQQYNNIRNSILQNPSIVRYLYEKYQIDFTKSSNKLKRTNSGKKNRSAKKLKNIDDDKNDNDNKNTVTDEQINVALQETKIVAPGWNSGKPTFLDASLNIFKFSFWLIQEIGFQARFIYQYKWLKQSYSDADREYLCRKHFQIDEETWTNATQEYRNELLNRPGIWKKRRGKNQIATDNEPTSDNEGNSRSKSKGKVE